MKVLFTCALLATSKNSRVSDFRYNAISFILKTSLIILKFLIKLLCCAVPIKKWRRKLRKRLFDDFFGRMDLSFFRKRIFNNYSKVKKQIIDKKKKIKVLFLVSEHQKWKCDSVYQELANDAMFDPIVAIVPLASKHKDATKIDVDIEDNINFFEDKNINYVVAYAREKHRYIDLKQYAPDIIFYQQPWGVCDLHSLKTTSQFALACYVSYTVWVNNFTSAMLTKIQTCAWKYFVETDANKKSLEQFYCETNGRFVVSGVPKLDHYQNHVNNKSSVRKTIIFAPHHSYPVGGLCYATFKWSGDIMLDFARNNPDIDCIFRPHPQFLRETIVHNVRTKVEIDAYYAAWESLGNGFICDRGDYLDLFAQSDVLITDCSSFIAEYLPTENPVILLVNKNSVWYNDLGCAIVENYYQVRNTHELESSLKNVIIDGNDPLKSERIKCLQLLKGPAQGSGKFIKDYLKQELHIA